MLKTIIPLSFINLSILEEELTIALFLVVQVLTDVFSTVRPGVYAFAIHFIKLPHPIVNSSIRPFVDSKAFNLVIFEFTKKLRVV